MAYIAISDISDKVLLNLVTSGDIEETENFLNDFALSLGVSATEIVSPIPFRFKQLGIAYASMIRAKFNSGKLIRDQALGIDFDPYQMKYDLYLKEVNTLKVGITKELLTIAPGSLKKSDFSLTMDIFRS